MAFKTPDTFPGPRVEEEVQFDDRTADGNPSVEGALRRVGSVLRYYVGSAVSQIARWKNFPVDFDGVDLSGIADGQGIAYNATSKQMEPTDFADPAILCYLIITTWGGVVYENNGEIILKETP